CDALGAAVVGALAARIGADDEKVGACALALVRDAGRNDDDIASVQLDALPVFATEPHACGASRDAEHLMRRAVIVMMAVDAVAPRAGTAVAVEHSLAGGGAVAVLLQRAAIDDKRQRVVRNDTVVGKAIGLDGEVCVRSGHSVLPFGSVGNT